MSYPTLSRVTLTTGVVAIIAALVGELIAYNVVRDVYGTALPVVASVVSAVPLVVAMIFLVVQAVPSGRLIVRIPGTNGVDAWVMLLILTQFVPLLELRKLVPPGVWGSTSGQMWLGFYALMLAAFFRVWQLNRGARVGVVLPARRASA